MALAHEFEMEHEMVSPTQRWQDILVASEEIGGIILRFDLSELGAIRPVGFVYSLLALIK
jgi:hypothetical protein